MFRRRSTPDPTFVLAPAALALVALMASVASILVWPGAAAAHSLRFGVLRVVLEDEGARVVLRAGGSEGAPPDLRLAVDGCALDLEPPRHDGNLLILTGQLRACRAGAAVRVEGLDREDVSLAARVERAGEVPPFGFLERDASRLTLDAGPRPAVFPRYLRLGAEHIAEGADHLLFVLLLAILAWRRRSVREVVVAVTGFTLGHSVTLSLSVLGAVHLPSAPVEACIALSIVFLAAEILRDREPSGGARHPVWVAAGFGLLHGLGFAGALREMGLPAGDAPVALLGFNLGVELGQLAFVAVLALAARVHLRLSGALPERGLAWIGGAVAAGWFALRATG